MDREMLLVEVKKIIATYINDASCGIFDCAGWLPDAISTLFHKDGVTIRICWDYAYFEVLGLTDAEFAEVERYYDSINKIY